MGGNISKRYSYNFDCKMVKMFPVTLLTNARWWHLKVLNFKKSVWDLLLVLHHGV